MQTSPRLLAEAVRSFDLEFHSFVKGQCSGGPPCALEPEVIQWGDERGREEEKVDTEREEEEMLKKNQTGKMNKGVIA